MKNILCPLLLLSICTLWSCEKEDPMVVVPPDNPSIYWDDFCSVDEIHWLPDNLHIIMSDHCIGGLKKINSITKYVQNIPVEDGHTIQKLYVSHEIKDSFFYAAHAYLENNAPVRLFSYNLKTRITTLVRSDLPVQAGYTLQGHRFVISGSPIEIIDLKTGVSKFINANGYTRAMSPDQKQMLVYDELNTVIYDFECDCTMDFPGQLNMQGVIQGVIWNNVGVFGYETTPADMVTQSRNLLINDFSGSFLLTSIDHYAGGPWSAYNGTQLLVFKYDPDKTERDGMLVSFDCINKTTREILISESDRLIRGISMDQVSVSPDQTKVAYVELSLSIVVAPLN